MKQFDFENVKADLKLKLELAKLVEGPQADFDSLEPLQQEGLVDDTWKRFVAINADSPICYYRVASALVGTESTTEICKPKLYKDVRIRDERLVVEYTPVKNAEGEYILTDRQKIECELTRFWRTKKSHWPRHFLCWLRHDTRELYRKKNSQNRGILLGVVGIILLVLRRLSLLEILKHLKPSLAGLNQTPAWVLDGYLLIWWGAAFVSFIFLPSSAWEGLPWWSCWLVLFLILQIAQTCFYHDIWRTLRQTDFDIQRQVHSRLRNFVIGISNILFVTWLFGVAYFIGNATQDDRIFESLVDAVFFSFTVAWSLGSYDISPTATPSFIKLTVVFQIVVTLFQVSALLGIIVGGLKPLPEAQSE